MVSLHNAVHKCRELRLQLLSQLLQDTLMLFRYDGVLNLVSCLQSHVQQ